MKTKMLLASLLLLASLGARAADGTPLPLPLQNLQTDPSAVAGLPESTVVHGRIAINPYDPVELNNLAVVKAEQGDVYAALDLLSRAARFAPEQAVITENRERLRNWLADRIGASRTTADLSYRHPPPDALPEPPALWP